MNCQTFSTGLSSGERGGRGRMVMLSGTVSLSVVCHPAWSNMRTAWAPGVTWDAISSRCHCMALSVAAGQDEGGADAAIGTDGAEDVSRLGALIVRRRGAGSLLGPAAGDLVLLSDPRFILPPQFYVGSGRQGGPHLCQRGGKVLWNGPP